jgi:hypothetical protein
MEPSPATGWVEKRKVFRPLLGWFVVTVVLLVWRNHQTQERDATMQFAVSLEGRAGRPQYEAELNGAAFEASGHSGLGHKQLRIAAPDAEMFVTNVFVGYGGKNLGHIRLARSRGTLELETVPHAERIVIEGAETNTALTQVATQSISLPTGLYKVRAEFARLSTEHEVETVAHRTRTLTIDPGLTQLSLRSNPTNAEFELQSLSMKNVTVQSNTPVTITDLPAGEYHLRIWRGDYQKTVPVKLSAVGTNDLQVEFDYAKITINSKPPGASIRDEKKILGTTPTSLTLPTGVHRLAVTRAGFFTTNVAFSLAANEDRTIELSLLSETYVAAMERARQSASGFFADLDLALTAVNAALQAKPGDEAALALKQSITFQRHLRDAREFQRTRQIGRALDEVESALKLKAGDADALALKRDLEKEQQAIMAAQAQARRELPGKSFEEAVQRVPHHNLFPSHEAKLPGQMREVRKKIIEALSRAPVWTVTQFGKQSEEVSVLQADTKGFSTRQSAIIVIGQTAENEVTVHWKLWTFTLSGNINLTLGGISDNSYTPLHPSYATPLTAATVERRRQNEIEQFKKRLELP